MNCLVGFLTLVFLADVGTRTAHNIPGCQTSAPSDTPVRSSLEQIHEAVQDKFYKTVTEPLQNLELGKKVSDFTSEALQSVQRYQPSPEFQKCFQKLVRDLNQKGQGKINQLRGQAKQVLEDMRQVPGAEKLQKIISELPVEAKHFTDDVKAQIQLRVEPLVQQFQDSISQAAEQARQSVQPLIEGLRQKMGTIYEDVYRSLVEEGQ